MLNIKKTRFKLLLILIGFFVLLVFLSGCASLSVEGPEKIEPKKDLRVIFLDIGQGDSSLIVTPENKIILIDGGPDDKVLSGLGKYLPLKQKKIDTVILTHPHADHLDGLVEVFKRYDVGEVFYTGVLSSTGTFLEWLRMIRDKNIKMSIVKEAGRVGLGGVQLEFLYPNQNLSALSSADLNASDLKSLKLNNLNNTSIVFKLIYNRTQFLFMGDAELPVEKILLEKGADLQADVLKVGHHGSNSSTGEEFLKKVSPQYAVISVGQDNDFGHPHLRTLRRLERHGVKILRTDEMGDIEFRSDGEKIYWH